MALFITNFANVMVCWQGECLQSWSGTVIIYIPISMDMVEKRDAQNQEQPTPAGWRQVKAEQFTYVYNSMSDVASL